jgi:hypothetical protein
VKTGADPGAGEQGMEEEDVAEKVERVGGGCCQLREMHEQRRKSEQVEQNNKPGKTWEHLGTIWEVLGRE